MSLRVTGLRDMDGQNPVERPERVEALLEVAQKFAGSDFSLGCFMSFYIIQSPNTTLLSAALVQPHPPQPMKN